MRVMLRKFFTSTITAKGSGFHKYADVPNIHLGLHYDLDIENFATTYNSTTMMGEQKHKVFKQHATHTNSRENDLQLLKATNTSQTLRFLLDGTFDNSYPRISRQLLEVVEKCPILKQRFLGCKETPLAETNQCSGIEVTGSMLRTSKTGSPVTLKSIGSEDKANDERRVLPLYREEYGVALHTGNYKIHYWGYFSGEPVALSREYDGQHRFRLKVNWFMRLRGQPFSFYRLKRIFTVTVGTMIRVFFVLEALERDTAQELEAAPFPVFKVTESYSVVSICKVDPTMFHFVSKGNGSWWFNPFVPHFL